MYEILEKKELATGVIEMAISCPRIAKHHKAGQFLMVMTDEGGERIPLTIADSDPVKGTVTIVFLEVGRSTIELGEQFKEGDCLYAVVGPLGTPTHIENFGNVVLMGGGLGVAPIYPVAKSMREKGNRVTTLIGFRRKDLMFWYDKLASTSDEVIVTTDDGSFGIKGFGITALNMLKEKGAKIDRIIAIGPPVMMRAVAEATRSWNIPTYVSLNTIMVDGTGMCGCCRVTIGEDTRFVCVDGPDFDGHLVNWDEMFKRMSIYKAEEKQALDANNECKIFFDSLKR